MINLIEAICEVKDNMKVTENNNENVNTLMEMGLLTYDIDIENMLVTAKISDQYKWIVEHQNKKIS